MLATVNRILKTRCHSSIVKVVINSYGNFGIVFFETGLRPLRTSWLIVGILSFSPSAQRISVHTARMRSIYPSGGSVNPDAIEKLWHWEKTIIAPCPRYPRVLRPTMPRHQGTRIPRAIVASSPPNIRGIAAAYTAHCASPPDARSFHVGDRRIRARDR